MVKGIFMFMIIMHTILIQTDMKLNIPEQKFVIGVTAYIFSAKRLSICIYDIIMSVLCNIKSLLVKAMRCHCILCLVAMHFETIPYF